MSVNIWSDGVLLLLIETLFRDNNSLTSEYCRYNKTWENLKNWDMFFE